MGSNRDDGPKALRLGAGPRLDGLVGRLVSSELKKKASRAKESVHE